MFPMLLPVPKKCLPTIRLPWKKPSKNTRKDAKRRQALEIPTESDRIKRDGNKQLSLEHMRAQARRSKKSRKSLMDRLFVELKDKLDNLHGDFREYHDLLEKQVKDAVEFAGGERYHDLS
jgi:molecular chaperone GrpE (heat shock protein)